MTSWKLEDAKNRFSEVIRRAAAEGPQLVTRHGKEAAVVLAVDEYLRLTQPDDLVEFLASSPLATALREKELVIGRSREPSRHVTF
jgi:prevent-host-death family protein